MNRSNVVNSSADSKPLSFLGREGLGNLFSLAFSRQMREAQAATSKLFTLDAKGQKVRVAASVPKGTKLIGFTSTGRDRFPTEEAAIEASWSRGRPAAPVPVFRAIAW